MNKTRRQLTDKLWRCPAHHLYTWEFSVSLHGNDKNKNMVQLTQSSAKDLWLINREKHTAQRQYSPLAKDMLRLVVFSSHLN